MACISSRCSVRISYVMQRENYSFVRRKNNKSTKLGATLTLMEAVVSLIPETIKTSEKQNWKYWVGKPVLYRLCPGWSGAVSQPRSSPPPSRSAPVASSTTEWHSTVQKNTRKITLNSNRTGFRGKHLALSGEGTLQKAILKSSSNAPRNIASPKIIDRLTGQIVTGT